MTTIKQADLDLNNQPRVIDLEKQRKVELRGADPRKSFFMLLSVGNVDGSIDDLGEKEGCEGYFEVHDFGFDAAEKKAIERAKQINAEYGDLWVYIYKCVPVARVRRSRPKVERIKAK